MWRFILFLSALVFFLGNQYSRGDDGKLWQVKDHLKFPLQSNEVPKTGCKHLRNVFLDDGDPSMGIGVLFHQHELVRKELQSLAAGLSLKDRPKEKDVQASGRVALVWWDMDAKKYHRSTATKNNTFKPDSHRLTAVLAVLDSKAIASGKWIDRDEGWKLPLPVKWTIPWAQGGYGFPEDWERTQGIGPSLGGIIPIEAGNFTGEQLGWDGFRNAIEDRIGIWIRKHPGDQAIVLMVYEYVDHKDKNPRCPAGYRFYAVSRSGSLDVQISAGIGTNKSGIHLTRDKGEVIHSRKKNF